jgi:hypothetical protein
MATTFPTTLDQLLNPAATDSVEFVSHSAQHSNANDAIEALEAKLGVDNSTDTSTIDYKVRDLISKIYTNEMAQDTIAAALAAGTHGNITVAYDDVANSLSLTATYDDEEVMDAIATSLTAGTGITKTYNDVANTITLAVDTSVIATLVNGFVPQSQLDIDERIQDVAAKLITDGTHYNITVSYNDTSSTLSLSANYDDEEVMDAIATSLTAGNGITKTYDDVANTITLAVDTTVIADRTYVNTAISNLIDSAPAVLDTLNEIAAAIGDDANFVTTITNALSLKAPLASPVFTGLPTAPTQSSDDNSTTIATTAFVQTAKTGATQNAKTYTDAAITALGNNTATTYVPLSEVGQADGIATLDENGKVPLDQLDIDEKIQDVAAGLITSGTHTNLTATYDDVTGKINFVAVAQLTQEQVQDAIGPLFAHGTNPNISVTYDDEANKMILEAYIPPSTAKMSPTAPLSPIDGQFWFDTDEYRSGNTRSLKVWNALSSTWEYVSTDLSLSTTNTWTSKNTFTNGIIIGLDAAPLTPVHGQIYYNKALNKLKVYDGLLWQDIQGSGGDGGGGLTLIPTDTSLPPSTFFVGLIAPPSGATTAGDLWIDVDDDAGSTEFVFAGPNPPAEGTYGMDTLWIDTDEPDLPLIYADEEPPTYTTVEGDFWVDLDDTSGQSILSSTTPPNPEQTEFWLDLTTEEGEITYSDLFKNNAAQITNFASLPAASLHGGMIAYVSSEASLYVAAAGQWIKIFPTFDSETLIWAGV